MNKVKIAIIAIIISLLSVIGCEQPATDISRQITVEETQDVVEETETVEEEVETEAEVEEPVITEEVKEPVEEVPQKIELSDYTDRLLMEVIMSLKEEGLENVTYVSVDGKTIEDDQFAYKVVSQSIAPSSQIDPDEELKLTCEKQSVWTYYLLSVDNEESEDKNDISVLIDDEEIATISKTADAKTLIKTDKGTHEIKFVRKDNEELSADYRFAVKDDSTVECVICSNKDAITVIKNEYLENFAEVTDIIPLLTGITADKAKALIDDTGIENAVFMVGEETIEPTDQLIVCEQDKEAESIKLKEDQLTLICKTVEEFYSDTFMGIEGSQIRAKSEELEITPKMYFYDTFIEYTEEFDKLSDEEKDNWTVAGIKDLSKDDEKILRFDVLYSGMVSMPQLVDVKLDDAKKQLTENKLYNIKVDNKTDVTNPNMLIVTGQNIKAGTETAGDTEIVLKVKKRVIPKPTPTPTPTPTKAPEPTKEAKSTEKAKKTYTFTDVLGTKYAKSTVNVRDIPDQSGAKIGSLSQNQEVSVTGKCKETGWYRIKYGNGVGYVSDSFLIDEKVNIAPPPKAIEEPAPNNNSNVSNNNSSSNNSGPAVDVPAGDIPGENLVWVPVNGGKKYHSKASCSGMIDPVQIPQADAEARGYTPCKRCH